MRGDCGGIVDLHDIWTGRAVRFLFGLIPAGFRRGLVLSWTLLVLAAVSWGRGLGASGDIDVEGWCGVVDRGEHRASDVAGVTAAADGGGGHGRRYQRRAREEGKGNERKESEINGDWAI